VGIQSSLLDMIAGGDSVPSTEGGGLLASSRISERGIGAGLLYREAPHLCRAFENQNIALSCYSE